MYWKICFLGTLQVLKKKKGAYTSAFESAGIGPFKLYWFKTYTSAFESASIGNIDSIPVPALFKSAGIGPGAS